MSDDIYHRCVALYQAGHFPQEIVNTTGLPRQKVLNAVNLAAKRGEIIRHRHQRELPLRYCAEAAQVKFGHIGDLDEMLSEDQKLWLVDEVARTGCESLLEYLAEVVRDLHAEATLPCP